ncbi:putative metal-binding protein [Rivularia sp. PCC 7116]|uniref:DUF411 domain-containing protein n=1 Tax=Rivularia sp. PCC 7116 TaxID=373994 RepID=UPI00029F15FC|nr:DUF411 domain-containing protein [Rivularia sp. PCC 7116]AFY55691.1 putative metal-binding protein [Rivularia sp. PCC 7116]
MSIYIIRSIIILIMAGIFYWLPFTGNQAQAMKSVWDKETQPLYSGAKEVTVYRSPYCGCCEDWVKHMQKHGFKIKDDIKTEEMAAIKQEYKVPQQLESCHTAIIDGYVMEGHVPADDIKRFVAQSPNKIGLSVPGMPSGTPGMEMGNKKDPFPVVSFNNNGEIQVFKEYRSY